MKSKALSIVVLLLTVVLFGLLFVNQRQEQRQTAYMQQLQKEAMPYEQEINDIRLELAQKQRAINMEEDTSGILFGFVPASADDFTEIDKLAAEHSITPVILLDCSQEKEQLAQILEKAVAKDYEVVLAGLQIDESILQTADEMKDLLAQIDDTKSPAFLLRNNVNTEETRNLLNEHGYTELILYDASLQAGIQTVFFLESNNSLIALIQRIDLVLINPVVNHNGLRNFLSLETVLYRLHQITADCDHKVTALAAELVEPHHGIGDELTLSVADSQHLLRVKVLNVINVLCVFYPLAPNAQ